MGDLISTAIVTAGGLIASKEVILKLLGPTADYLGESARDLVKRSAYNLGRVVQATCDKLHDKINHSGQVNPRVLKGVVDEGRFIEDVVASEYFGGLLASSWTERGTDDTAVPFLSLVKSLSTNQIRLHFIIYRLVARILAGKECDAPTLFCGLRMRFDIAELLASLKLEGHDGQSYLLLALDGLVQERLLDTDLKVRIGSYFRGAGMETPGPDVVVVSPNERGASLFLRALGLRGLSPEVITSVNVDYSLTEAIRAEVAFPDNVTIDKALSVDSASELTMLVNDRVSDFEDEIEDLKDHLSELVQQVADLQDDGAVSE